MLIDGDILIYDSLAIMEYANDLGGGSLLPAELKLRAHTRSLVAWQHSGLSNLCGQLSFESSFYRNRRCMTINEVSEAERIFGMWENGLQRSGGPYLVGKLSLADLAFVPTVLRIIAHKPSLDSWPLTHAWSERLLARNTVQEWLQEAVMLPVIQLDDYGV